MTDLASILDDIRVERVRQVELWGDQSGRGRFFMLTVLGEEVGEACEAAINEATASDSVLGQEDRRYALLRLRAELVQVAAVAVQIIEQIDNETGPKGPA